MPRAAEVDCGRSWGLPCSRVQAGLPVQAGRQDLGVGGNMAPFTPLQGLTVGC